MIGGVTILVHDACRSLKVDVTIGNNCFYWNPAIILPDLKIGDEVIVAAGAVVTKYIPSKTIVAGNLAKIIRENINCGR